MSTIQRVLSLGAVALGLGLLPGCESSDSGGGNVSGSVYYGVGFYDPWYGGGYYYDDDDIIVAPPDRPDRPDRPERPVSPEHPIAKPPPSRPTPAPTAMPSIPAMPRPMPRGGGRR